MKTTWTLLILLAASFAFSQEPTFHLKVDSLLYEGDAIYQIPEKNMSMDIKDGKMILSGYNMFMEEAITTEYTLANELGKGSDNGNYRYYRVNLYYNNPVPDNDLEIYQYKNGEYKLIISSAAMITEFYCTDK